MLREWFKHGLLGLPVLGEEIFQPLNRMGRDCVGAHTADRQRDQRCDAYKLRRVKLSKGMRPTADLDHFTSGINTIITRIGVRLKITFMAGYKTARVHSGCGSGCSRRPCTHTPGLPGTPIMRLLRVRSRPKSLRGGKQLQNHLL